MWRVGSSPISRTSSLPGLLRSVSAVGLCPLGENCATQPRRSLQIEAKLALRFVQVKGVKVKDIKVKFKGFLDRLLFGELVVLLYHGYF